MLSFPRSFPRHGRTSEIGSNPGLVYATTNVPSYHIPQVLAGLQPTELRKTVNYELRQDMFGGSNFSLGGSGKAQALCWVLSWYPHAHVLARRTSNLVSTCAWSELMDVFLYILQLL